MPKKVFKLSSETCFLYDGWNMVKEIKTVNKKDADNCYVWGLDLSQSREGGGWGCVDFLWPPMDL